MFLMKGWCSSCEKVVETSIEPRMVQGKLTEDGKCPFCSSQTASVEAKCAEFYRELKRMRRKRQ